MRLEVTGLQFLFSTYYRRSALYLTLCYLKSTPLLYFEDEGSTPRGSIKRLEPLEVLMPPYLNGLLNRAVKRVIGVACEFESHRGFKMVP